MGNRCLLQQEVSDIPTNEETIQESMREAYRLANSGEPRSEAISSYQLTQALLASNRETQGLLRELMIQLREINAKTRP